MENDNGGALARRTLTTTGALLTKAALASEAEQRTLLAEYVRSQMVEGTDFGVIPGTKTPTLLKPGAEKLVELFRCTPEYEIVDKREEFEHGFFHYMFRVRVVQRDSGAVLGEGYGSANSREARYRWRTASLRCPECGGEALLKSKEKPEFFCWKKKGGCGAVLPADDARVTSQKLGKVENEDTFTMANTVLKMAKKRALVDGAIALARCSDMFSQDLEDLADTSHAPDEAPKQAKKPAAKQPRPPPSPPSPPSDLLTPEQQAHGARVQRIWKRAQAAGIGRMEFPSWVLGELTVDTPSKDWTPEQMARLEGALDAMEPPPSE